MQITIFKDSKGRAIVGFGKFIENTLQLNSDQSKIDQCIERLEKVGDMLKSYIKSFSVLGNGVQKVIESHDRISCVISSLKEVNPKTTDTNGYVNQQIDLLWSVIDAHKDDVFPPIERRLKEAILSLEVIKWHESM